MSWFDFGGISDFFSGSSGAVNNVVAHSSDMLQPNAMGGNWGAVADAATESDFGWIGEAWDEIKGIDGMLPSLALGAASGIGGYLTQKEALDQQQQQWKAEMAQEERFRLKEASTGNDNYGSHVSNIAGGTGLLSSEYYNPYQK